MHDLNAAGPPCVLFFLPGEASSNPPPPKVCWTSRAHFSRRASHAEDRQVPWKTMAHVPWPILFPLAAVPPEVCAAAGTTSNASTVRGVINRTIRTPACSCLSDSAHLTRAWMSGRLVTPSPAEHTERCEYQAGQASTDDGAGHRLNGNGSSPGPPQPPRPSVLQDNPVTTYFLDTHATESLPQME